MKIRKRPVVVDGIRYVGIPDDLRAWLADVGHDPSTPLLFHDPDVECGCRAEGSLMRGGQHAVVQTLEGDLVVPAGWWVIRGVKGELYPCRPDVFAETYELVDGDYDRTVMVIAPTKLAFEHWAERQLRSTGEGRAWGAGDGTYTLITNRTRYQYVPSSTWLRGRTADSGLVLAKSSRRPDYEGLINSLQLVVRDGPVVYGATAS